MSKKKKGVKKLKFLEKIKYSKLYIRLKDFFSDVKKRTYAIIAAAGALVYLFLFIVVAHTTIVMENNPEYNIVQGLSAGWNNMMKPGNFLAIFPIPWRAFTSMLLITTVLAVVIFSIAVRARLMKHYNPEEALGDAHFLSEKELKEYNMRCTEPFGKPYASGNKNVILAKGFELSMDNKVTNRNVNQINVAGSGRGKTFRFVVPNLLQANASFVCTDPSGGIYRGYGNFFEEMGYKIKCLNLAHMERSNHYNPFRYIRDDKDIAVLVDMLIANTTPEGHHSGDPFWEKSEANAFNAIIALQFHYLGPKLQNFRTTANLIRMLDVDENSGEESANDKLADMFARYEKQDPNGYAFSQYKNLMSAAGKTIKSIVASCLARIRPFDLEAVGRLTADDDIDLEAVGDEKTALFVIIPTGEKTFNFIASLLYSQLFTRLYDYCENEAIFSQVVRDGDNEVVRVFRSSNKEDAEKKKALAKIYIEDLKKARIVKNKQFNWYEIRTKSGEFVTYRRREEAAERELELLRSAHLVKNGESLPIHTRLMLDEFANIGGIPDFDTKVSTIRKYGISVTIILQSLEQIKKAYKNDWSTICSNCDNIIYMGGGADPETTKWFAELIGKETRQIMGQSYSSNRSGNTSINSQGVELAAAAKLRTLKDRELVILPTGMMPYKGVMSEPQQHPNWKYVGNETYLFDRKKVNFFNMMKKNTKYFIPSEKEVPHQGVVVREEENIDELRQVNTGMDESIADEMINNASVTGESIIKSPVDVDPEGEALKKQAGVKTENDIVSMITSMQELNRELSRYYTKFASAPLDRKRRAHVI